MFADYSVATAGHAALSRVLAKNCVKDYTKQGEVLRDWFSKTSFESIRPYSNHTHGLAAATRSAGVTFIDRVMAQVAETPVYYQGSSADERHGRKMSRDWFWAKDLSVDLRETKQELSQPTAMVDVDEYVDMPQLLAIEFRPYIIYTFQPSTAAKDSGDYSYTFNSDGTIHYVVAGGGVYDHAVWDYGHDSLLVQGSEWLWLGHGLIFPIRCKTVSYYKVERRNVDEDHQIILMTPLKQWTQVFPGGFADLALHQIQAPKLERLNPVEGGFARLRVQRDGLWISTARVGDYRSVTVPVGVDEEVAAKSLLTKDKLTVAMTKSSMYVEGSEQRGAEILTLFHRSNVGADAPVMFSTTDGVRSFQFCPKLSDYDPEAPPMMKAFMRPLVDGGFCPDKCKNNEVRSIRTRVLAVKCQTRLTARVESYVKEFVQIIAARLPVLHPVDEEEVWKRQARPSQQRILRDADLEEATNEARTFGKAQAEGNVGDPRNITTINGVDKREYSRFMYALADALKVFPWFVSGNKPRQTAARIAAITRFAQWVVETDFSRMDGRVGEVPRFLELLLVTAVFAKQYLPRLRVLLASQTFLHCVTHFGVKYNSEWSRASGSPETSVFNTLLAAFVIFLTYRLQGLGIIEAFEKLGAFLGDDGVSADVKVETALRAATMVGQKLTINVVPHGEVVSFLSRYYGPDVWFGSLDSCCDLRRQLTKFHLATVVEKDVQKKLIKLREKAFAFWLTDEFTPVIGDFVCKVLSFAPVHHGADGPGEQYTNVLSIWNSQVPKQDQYPSYPDDAGWKRALLEKQLPDFSIETFLYWVDHATSLEKLMDPPTTEPIPAVHPGQGDYVVVDGDVRPPPIDTKSSMTDRSSRRGKRGGKRHSPASKSSKPSEAGLEATTARSTSARSSAPQKATENTKTPIPRGRRGRRTSLPTTKTLPVSKAT